MQQNNTSFGGPLLIRGGDLSGIPPEGKHTRRWLDRARSYGRSKSTNVRLSTIRWFALWRLDNETHYVFSGGLYSALRIHGTRQTDLRFARSYVISVWSVRSPHREVLWITVNLWPAEYADIFRSHDKRSDF